MARSQQPRDQHGQALVQAAHGCACPPTVPGLVPNGSGAERCLDIVASWLWHTPDARISTTTPCGPARPALPVGGSASAAPGSSWTATRVVDRIGTSWPEPARGAPLQEGPHAFERVVGSVVARGQGGAFAVQAVDVEPRHVVQQRFRRPQRDRHHTARPAQPASTSSSRLSCRTALMTRPMRCARSRRRSRPSSGSAPVHARRDALQRQRHHGRTSPRCPSGAAKWRGQCRSRRRPRRKGKAAGPYVSIDPTLDRLAYLQDGHVQTDVARICATSTGIRPSAFAQIGPGAEHRTSGCDDTAPTRSSSDAAAGSAVI